MIYFVRQHWPSLFKSRIPASLFHFVSSKQLARWSYFAQTGETTERNHMEVLQEMDDAASDEMTEGLVLTQRRRDALRAVIDLICGLEVDNTSDDGNGNFTILGSTEWSLLSDFGFKTPGYPKPELLYHVTELPDGRVALSMEDVLEGKYFGPDGRVKILPDVQLRARLLDMEKLFGIIREAQEEDNAE